MRKLLLTDQAARLVRSLALTRVAENARLLTRVDNNAPETWLKDVRREIDTCVAISAQLGEGGDFVGAEEIAAATGNVATRRLYPARGRDEKRPQDVVPPELAEIGVTLQQHRRALDPLCVHGKTRFEECKDCERANPPVGATVETSGQG